MKAPEVGPGLLRGGASQSPWAMLFSPPRGLSCPGRGLLARGRRRGGPRSMHTSAWGLVRTPGGCQTLAVRSQHSGARGPGGRCVGSGRELRVDTPSAHRLPAPQEGCGGKTGSWPSSCPVHLWRCLSLQVGPPALQGCSGSHSPQGQSSDSGASPCRLPPLPAEAGARGPGGLGTPLQVQPGSSPSRPVPESQVLC